MRKFLIAIILLFLMVLIVFAQGPLKKKSSLEKYLTPMTVTHLEWYLLEIFIDHKDSQVLSMLGETQPPLYFQLDFLVYSYSKKKILMNSRIRSEVFGTLSTLEKKEELMKEVNIVSNKIKMYIPEFEKEGDFWVQFNSLTQNNVLIAEYIDGELILYDN